MVHARRAPALRAGGGGTPAGRLPSTTPPSTDNTLWKATSRLAMASVAGQGALPRWPLPTSQPPVPLAAEGADAATLVQGSGRIAAAGTDNEGPRRFAGYLHTQQPEEAAHGALCQCSLCLQQERVTCSQ